MRWNSIVQALMLASMATVAFPLHAAEPLPLLLHPANINVRKPASAPAPIINCQLVLPRR